jgi:thiosulfate/3-mercaptopyruvate sulfurtransferase
MNTRLLSLACALAAASTTLLPGHSALACFQTRPVVSADWLARHLDRPDLVLVDIRSDAEYLAGHITGAINIPFAMPTSAWTVSGTLLMEVPAQADLFAALGTAGISRNSYVIVINNTAVEGVPPSYPRAQTARVAITLLYAGVRDVAILDGGVQKWLQEGRPWSTDPVTPTPVTYDARVHSEMFVTKDQVAASLGNPKKILLDARDASVYAGTVVEPYAPVAGHIPGAVNLPAPQIWNDDGTFKSREELRQLVTSVLGCPRGKEIIVYCGVGGYASGWWFVLTEILGYDHVKFYDGSAQEWVADPAGPMETN